MKFFGKVGFIGVVLLFKLLHAADPVIDPVIFKGEGSSLCLDAGNGVTVSGTQVTIESCVAGSASQKWQLTASGEIRIFGTARCLDASGASTADSTPLIVWPCNGGFNQKWDVDASANSYGTVRVQGTTAVWDAKHAATAAGTLIQIYHLNGGSNQMWQPQGKQPDVVTRHNDFSRTGANMAEKLLTPALVTSAKFGKLFSRALDGQTYAQPLYVGAISVSGATRNVVYVATMKNSVYAFDADDPNASSPLWQVNLGNPVPVSDYPTGYGDITGQVGILSTPVIDRSSNAMYVVAATKEGSSSITYHYRINVLDIRNGNLLMGSGTDIQGTVPGTGDASSNGQLPFQPYWHLQRPALLLTGGQIIIAFGSHGDQNPYHGWLFAYDAKAITRTAVYTTTPNAAEGAIWQSGQGPSVDANGYIYVATGNCLRCDATQADARGESILKLSISGSAFKVLDYFTPYNWKYLDDNDLDFGNTGVLLVPGTTTIITINKPGTIYVANSNNLGHIVNNDMQVQKVTGSSAGYIYNSPVFWNNALYVWPENDVARAFSYSNGVLSMAPTSIGNTKADRGPPFGAAISLSALGSGNGILWGVCKSVLYAYDATNLAHELYNSAQNQARDALGTLAKFNPPTVVNGKVYVPTFSNSLVVYGLL